MNAMGLSIGEAGRAAALISCLVVVCALSSCGDDETSSSGDSSTVPAGEPDPASRSTLAGHESEQTSTAGIGGDVDPSQAGRIAGFVVYGGGAPARAPLPVTGEAYCVGLAQKGAGLLDESLMVQEGRLANAFIWIAEGLERWRFPRAQGSVDLDQSGCAYVPRVLGLRKGQTLRLINSDPVLHNVHSVGQRNGEKNLAMPFQGQIVEWKFKRPETMVQLNCDVHAWMRGYIGVVDHPCFAVSGSDGSFAIEGVPPGDYVLRLWHETLGTREVKLTVAPSQTIDLGELAF